jgi:Holliday junction resolvase
MRRAAKTDANQSEIVSALRKIGATVQPLHGVGEGCPDLVCGYRGRNLMLEVKDGSKPPSARKLTKDQVRWHEQWRGQVCVVCNIEEAIAAVMGETSE